METPSTAATLDAACAAARRYALDAAVRADVAARRFAAAGYSDAACACFRFARRARRHAELMADMGGLERRAQTDAWAAEKAQAYEADETADAPAAPDTARA